MSLKICIPAMAAFILAACGGDGNKAGDPDPSAEADFVVESFGDLSVCTDKREGATAYVKDEEKDYICTNGGWTINTNADTRKKSSSSKDKANSSNSKDEVKSSSSRHCEDYKDEAISSSSSVKSKSSSSKLSFSKKGCKTESEDNCEYGELVDDRDGQTYKTVKIGDQWWMAENLNYATLVSYCFNYVPSNCIKYGRRYTWAAAVDKSEIECGSGTDCPLPPRGIQGVCPSGWHLPNNTEWKTLLTAVGGLSTAGMVLKSSSDWNDLGCDGSIDAFGFSVLPIVSWFQLEDGEEPIFSGERYMHFWSSTRDSNGGGAHAMSFYCENDNTGLVPCTRDREAYVRCLKDDSISSSSKDNVKSSSSRCEDCKDETISSDSSATQKPAWDYLNPNIDYGEFVDDRDGQIYKTVKIGDQVWMAENLNFKTKYSWCGGVPDEDEGDCSKYGRLYTWGAAVGKSGEACGYDDICGLSGNVRGVCPEGWHLPDTTEWNTLFFDAVGGLQKANNALKSQTGWEYNGTDTYGFSALPTGVRDYTGYISVANAEFWSVTERDFHEVYGMRLHYFANREARRSYYGKSYAIAIRCLKD